MSFISKMAFYVLAALLLSTYVGLRPDYVMPDALVDLDDTLGNPIMSTLNNIHDLGEDHLGEAKEWLAVNLPDLMNQF